MTSKERSHINLDDDFDISEFQPVKKETDKEIKKTIEKVAEQYGFVSRKNRSQRRRKPKSPFKNQLNLKCRDNIKELFQDLGEQLGVHDHTTFEQALLALIEKNGFDELLQRYKGIMK